MQSSSLPKSTGSTFLSRLSYLSLWGFLSSRLTKDAGGKSFNLASTTGGLYFLLFYGMMVETNVATCTHFSAGTMKSLEIILQLPLTGAPVSWTWDVAFAVPWDRKPHAGDMRLAQLQGIDHPQVTSQLVMFKMPNVSKNQPLVEMHLKPFNVTITSNYLISGVIMLLCIILEAWLTSC